MAYDSRPVYRWFNGGVSMLAEPMNDPGAWDFRIAGTQTPGAKIYPFRPIVNGMVLDRRGFGYDPNFDARFTMAAAMEQMAGPLKMMGFMRPEGLNERERAAMAQFPNLLSFDKEHYVHTGNVREAASIGMARLALMMGGQDPWSRSTAELIQIGDTLWSGDLLGLDLPNNPMDPNFRPDAGPTQATGSFISLSHAVKRTGALHCADCHTSQGVLDYRVLGFDAGRTARLQTMWDQVQVLTAARTPAGGLRLRWSARPAKAYQVVVSSALGSGGWTPVGSRLGDATSPNWWYEADVAPTDLAGASPVFIRIQELQP